MLQMTQTELAQMLDVTQPTVHDWERLGRFPSRYQRAVRAAGKKKRSDWSDSWFFEVTP